MKFYALEKPSRGGFRLFRKTLLVMKFTAVFLLVACMQVSAKTGAQTITLSCKNTSLETVFKEIKKQTGYDFFYENALFENKVKINVDLRNTPLEKALDICLKDQPVSWSVIGKIIVLKYKEKLAQLFVNPEGTPPQPVKVSGIVRNEKGEPVPSASIIVKGTSIGAKSNAAGEFSIFLPDGKTTLLITSVGYESSEVVASANERLEVALKTKTSAQEEVVVIGYGSQSKRNLASATSKVSADEFKSAVNNTVEQAIQGRATGITVHEVTGEPGAPSIIRVRGNNSLSGNNEPLYVVDGFPMPSYVEASTNAQGVSPQNGLYGINPADIESIEILKDASATAIYGSRGANGVVVITTKAGKRGEGKVELVNKTTFGHSARPLQMMSGRQFAEIYNEYSERAGYPKPFGNLDTINQNTNWFDAISRNSFRQDVSMNVSGGNLKTGYYLATNYLKDRGVIIGSDLNRGSLRANINSDVNNWYSIKSQFSYSHQKSNRGVSSNGAFPQGTGLLLAFQTPPLYHLADGDGSTNTPSVIPGNSPGYFANPLKGQTDRIDIQQNDYTILNLENIFSITSGLKLHVSLGGAQNLTRRHFFAPVTVSEGSQVNGASTNSSANTYSYNVVTYLNYLKNISGRHNVNLTLGTEYNNEQVELLSALTSGYDINTFGPYNLGSAATQQTFSYKQKRVIQSAFLRGNYTFADKYIVNASIRADQASPFAANKKTGYFPSVALGWNLNNENFMSGVKVITNAKIRTSYGVTGSQAIGPYNSLSTYTTGFYNGSLVVFPASIGNANLSWESTRQFDAGFDFNTLNNLLTISFDYYNKRTEGLLQPHQLPSQSGTSSILDNFGTVNNKGVEVSVQARAVQTRNFNYTTRINLSKNRNLLLDLGDVKSSQYQLLYGNLQSGVYSILTPGQELGQLYGYKISGLVQQKDFTGGKPTYTFPGNPAFQIPGAWKYEDTNNDGKITGDDRTVLGNVNPKFTYGWTNDFTFKHINLNLFFTGSVGNKILNMTRHYLGNGLIKQGTFLFNQTEDWYTHRWTPANQQDDVRYPGTQIAYFEAGGDITSAEVESGTYFRLKQVALSYDFPSYKVVKSPRLFLTGTNVFTVTKYSGFDPEVSSYGQVGLRQGVDWANYPTQRSYTIGFSCNF